MDSYNLAVKSESGDGIGAANQAAHCILCASQGTRSMLRTSYYIIRTDRVVELRRVQIRGRLVLQAYYPTASQTKRCSSKYGANANRMSAEAKTVY